MSKTTKFSIITVCFNNSATIGRTLQSLSAQTWRDYEHIIVDGASTDDTARVVAKYADLRTLFKSERDSGIYDAMNKGIARATGDVIAFLNADDFYAAPDILESVAQRINTGDVDALLGDVDFFRPDAPDKAVRRYNSGQFAPERIGSGWMPAHPAMFVRRAVFEKVGLFRTDYRIAADFEWVARAFHDRSVRYVYYPRVLVRMQMGGASTQGLKSTILLNREILRACRENGIQTNVFRLLRKFPRKLLELIRP